MIKKTADQIWLKFSMYLDLNSPYILLFIPKIPSETAGSIYYLFSSQFLTIMFDNIIIIFSKPRNLTKK